MFRLTEIEQLYSRVTLRFTRGEDSVCITVPETEAAQYTKGELYEISIKGN